MLNVVNGKKVEKAFVFEGIPVLEDMNIYARWGSHFSVDYKIYYKLRKTGEDIADPTMGSAIVGNNKTFYAKTETDLYEKFRVGYYPETSSHTITMSADGNHESAPDSRRTGNPQKADKACEQRTEDLPQGLRRRLRGCGSARLRLADSLHPSG